MKYLYVIPTLCALVLQVRPQDTGLAPKKFLSLPLGAVQASGWIHDQLVVQANGLAGHEHNFYHYVSQSDWIGGNSYYSSLEEAGSYWFNGMVPLGVLLNDSTIQAQTQQFLDYVLDHQDSTGWLGPEVNTTKPRYLWGRYPFFFGAIQMVEANPSLADRVVPALHKFVSLANSMLHSGQGLEDWTNTRWEDFVITLQWLYDLHPDGQEAILIDTMKMLKWTGDPWEQVFSPAHFPQTAVEHLRNPFPVLTWHGVNMAEGLKALPSTYRFTHNQSDLDAASVGWDLLFQYHGRPSGIYAADEYLAGLEAVRGTLCDNTPPHGIGNDVFVERITYNALPATLTGGEPTDMWSRQYLQQQNQIASKNMTPNPFPEDGPYSNVFGLEPNYPESPSGLAQVQSRPHGSIAVHRGPLHYAFDIPRTEKVLTRNSQEPRAVDLEFDASSDWQYAIDPSTLRFNAGTPAGGKLPSPIFDSGLPPLTITAAACPITWTVAGDTFAAAPPTNPACTGQMRNITLWPFGATKLRIGEFPVFDSTK
ncbi:hypothetical protein NLI96_g750 [Meripilus lineatus]|uniref:Uncharacterized protein n=1 Tax=Meripilus lineatus TaxID=2056292 RepID=A0AAD5VBS8_9APHY|nr:hypothetical protein NLI96_g750 [Physisporinus lineatus]